MLPTDSHTPLAFYVASFGVTDFKRYCVHQVYTDHHSIGAPPEANSELAFDIVSPPSVDESTLRQSDAEVLRVFANVLKDCTQSNIMLQLSHHLLVDAILIYCQVPDDQRSKVCRQLVQKLKSVPNGAIGFVADEDEQLKRVWKLLSFTGSFSSVEKHLKRLPDWIGSDAAILAERAFKELEEIINLAGAENRGQKNRIFIQLNLIVGLENYETHSGFLFRFIYELIFEE